jgi:hypothetical protein
MRLFTLEEATEALEQVRPLAERMVELAAALRPWRSEIDDIAGRAATNGHGQELAARLRSLEEQLTVAADELRAIVEEIQGLGVQVKDVDIGLVDFPTRRGDEIVLLCWRVGEDAIAFWHGLEEGFAGRKPI